jgi:hypothetical protein
MTRAHYEHLVSGIILTRDFATILVVILAKLPAHTVVSPGVAEASDVVDVSIGAVVDVSLVLPASPFGVLLLQALNNITATQTNSCFIRKFLW